MKSTFLYVLCGAPGNLFDCHLLDEQLAIEKVHHGEYMAEHRRGLKRKRMPDEGAADEADLIPRDRFKIQTYLVMIDSLLAELKK